MIEVHRPTHRCETSGDAMTKTLLVPLDGSDAALRALPVAGRLSRLLDADVTLVAAELPGSPESPDRDWLAGLVPKIGVRGARLEIVRGLEVADALGALAADVLEPVVCMATHARAPIGRAWFGSVAEDVLRTLTLPVVLVGPRFDAAWKAHGPLVVAVDGSDAAYAALGVALEWDRTLERGVTLVHVAHPLDVDLVPDAVLDTAKRRYPGVAMDASVVRSREPEWEIVDFARGLDASLVVCASHGRSGARRLVMGSVAMGVVHRASCPVLVHRPVALPGHSVQGPSVTQRRPVAASAEAPTS